MPSVFETIVPRSCHMRFSCFFLMIRRPPRSTRTATLVPDTTLFRSSELPGVRLRNHGFFNEFTLVLDSDARLVVRELADRNILGGVSLGRLYPEAPDIRNGLVIAVTETTTSEDVDALAQGLREILA